MRIHPKIIAILVVASLHSCKEDDPQLIIDPCGIDFRTTVHYAAIGDEFSSGLYIEEGSAWSDQIAEYITDQGYNLSAYAQVGSYGEGVDELILRVDQDNDAQCKNLITIMVGAHDHWEGMSTVQFATAYDELLQKAVSRTGDGDKVICVTLPDYSIAPGLPESAGSSEDAQAMIIAYNEQIMTLAEARGARVADIFPISQSAYQFLYVPEDSLHADADQHNLWTNVISAQIIQALD